MTKKPLKTNSATKPYLESCQTWQMCPFRPTHLHPTWLYCSAQGMACHQHYRGATIFVDHFPQLWYIHFHMTLMSEETIQAKMAFETFAASDGVKIQQYHMRIMATLQTMHSSITMKTTRNFSPTAELMLTSKIEFLKDPSGMFRSKSGNLCSMLSTNGQEWWIWVCGLMQLSTLYFSWMCCHLRRMESPDLKSLETFLLVTSYQTVTHLSVLCMFCKCFTRWFNHSKMESAHQTGH